MRYRAWFAVVNLCGVNIPTVADFNYQGQFHGRWSWERHALPALMSQCEPALAHGFFREAGGSGYESGLLNCCKS